MIKGGFAVSLGVALVALGMGVHAASAQAPALPPPSVCGQFQPLSADTQQKASLAQVAMKARADRKQICALLNTFVIAESKLIKFLVDNKTWCGVPDQVVTVSQANHEKSMKFRDLACNDNGPKPKAPTLSDAIRTPSVDSATNTKTGRGTFDTLTGNPLGK
jgi:hypothetical protein